MLKLGLGLFAAVATPAVLAAALQNRVSVEIDDAERCFASNGIPDHATGTFPNRGNPNAISEQDLEMCVTSTPVRGTTAQPVRGAIGIAVNGVQFRPTTAGFYDPNGRRGHSRNGGRNWSLDINGAPGRLGLDFNNAHVGRGGLYHYHGIANSLLETSGSTLIGYAADGFEMHYVGSSATSGYELKQGARPEGGPPGDYDGTYNEDYVFVADKGLDECNGGTLDGRFVYFVTDSYPFVGRCLWGEISEDFAGGEHNARQRGGREQSGRQRRGNRQDRGQRRPGQP